tara:strand:- start:672 stop:785 length:114 start_codon:yes stop_codon:yes gene_type:complete
MLKGFVLTYFSTDVYEILIVQDPEGNLLTIKIDEYEP